MEWYFLGWFLFALFILFIYFLIVIRALTTRRDISEEDEFSGVMEFEQSTDSIDSNNDNRVRDDFDREC